MLVVVWVDVQLQTPTCFSTDVPSSESYYNEGVQAKLPIYFIIKPTRCTNFPNLLWHETLHVSGSSPAHHQQFIHCTLDTGICHTALWTAFEQDQDGSSILVLLESCLQTCMTYTSAECTVNKLLTMGRGTARNV